MAYDGMSHDEIMNIFYSIQANSNNEKVGYLDHDIDLTIKYVEKTKKIKGYVVSKTSDPRPGTYEKNRYAYNMSTLFYRTDENSFGRRADIAIGLADIVLFHTSYDAYSNVNVDKKRIMSCYYAEVLLESRAESLGTNNLVRLTYSLNKTEVSSRMKSLFPFYNSNRLSDAEKKEIKSKYSDVCRSAIDEGYLTHDAKLVGLYRESMDGKRFGISKRPSSNVKTGSIIFYENRCNIWYPLNVDSIKKRLLIAHELGHAALHKDLEGADETDLQRRDATYFARLLLEYRTELYLNGKDGLLYSEECKKIENAIRSEYYLSGKNWLDWIYC